MLTVFRVPLLDFRPFAADTNIYRNVRLPGSWSEGEFVRGAGVIRERPQHSVKDWPAERVYADFKGSVRLEPQSVEKLNSRLESAYVHNIYRRLWYALPVAYGIFDYDFAASFQVREEFDPFEELISYTPLSSLTRVAAASAESLVTVGPWQRGESPPLRTTIAKVGDRLARHFAVSTATSAIRGISGKFIEAGRPVIAIEGTKVTPKLDIARKINRYQIDDVEVLGFTLPITGSGPVRCFCILSGDNSRATFRKVRELRVHLLRLHSIREFLASLAQRSYTYTDDWDPSYLAMERSPAYDRLQQAIIEILKILQQVKVAGVGETPNLLSAAFLAYEFITDNSLYVLEERLLASARPAVLKKLRELADEERARRKLDRILEASRDRSGVLAFIEGDLNVAKYDMRNSNIGAAGDNASASNFAQGQGAQVVTIDGHDVDRFKLVAELRQLQESIGRSETQDEDSKNALSALSEAEEAAKTGDGERVKTSLAKVGRWVWRLAEAIGTALAAEVIKRAAGL